jgi:hypothetical protein
MDWIDLAQDRGQVTGSLKHGNEHKMLDMFWLVDSPLDSKEELCSIEEVNIIKV